MMRKCNISSHVWNFLTNCKSKPQSHYVKFNGVEHFSQGDILSTVELCKTFIEEFNWNQNNLDEFEITSTIPGEKKEIYLYILCRMDTLVVSYLCSTCISREMFWLTSHILIFKLLPSSIPAPAQQNWALASLYYHQNLNLNSLILSWA